MTYNFLSYWTKVKEMETGLKICILVKTLYMKFVGYDFFLVIIITFPQKFTEILDCGSQYIFELASFLPSHLTPVSYFLFCRLEITAQPAL